MSLNRRQFMQALSSETFKTIWMMSAGGVALGAISHVHVEGLATVESRQRARDMIKSGTDYDEATLTKLIEREYAKNTESMTIVGTVTGMMIGSLASQLSQKSPAPQEPDPY